MAFRFTLRQLEYFVAVGEAGSIANASARVSVSSPSISAAIAQLETEPGIQLFVRKHAHGLSLTPGGRRLFNAAKTLLEDARGLHTLAGDITGRAQGQLNVGCLLTFAPFVMPALRRSFENACPGISCRPFERHHAQLLEMLRRAELDVMLPARHALAMRDSVSVADLAEEPMVLLDLPLSGEYFLSIFHAQGVRPRIAERTSDMAVMRALVANGFRYALANVRPRTAAAPDGKPLRFVQLAGQFRPMIMGLATIRSEHRTRALQAFFEHCASHISSRSVPGLSMGIAHPPGAPV